MKPVKVENVMNSPVYSISEDRTAAEALDEMNRQGVKKILVTAEDGTPKGILEAWKITKMDGDKMISDFELSAPTFVQIGTEMAEVQQALRETPAVYVFDPKDKKRILGIITAYDNATLY